MATMSNVSPFYGFTDKYGKVLKDPVPPQPLTFDKAMENRLPSSPSALFRLPMEILGVIVSYVDWPSLSNLALVNRDCRQLSRSRQFSGVYLNYTESSEALLNVLVSEAAERAENNGFTVRPSLGACIRRLAVTSSIDIKRQRFDIPEIPFDGDDQHFRVLLKAQTPQWNVVGKALDLYHRLLLLVLGSSGALPHLEVLDWEDEANLVPNFFSELACSSIQHLKLNRPIVSKGYTFELPPSRVHLGWPLRTLHLGLVIDWSLYFDIKTAMLCARMLRYCAPTLETFYWTGFRREDAQTFGGGLVPDFPQLRNLRLDGLLQITDMQMLDSFFDASLVNLGVRNRAGVDMIKEALIRHGYMPSLSAFSMGKPPVEFLQSNKQLCKLDLPVPGYSSEELEREVLPLLSTFPHLESLRISWPEECESIPEAGLRLIGKLQTLKQLAITCGVLSGWQRTWRVDHDAMRRNLSPLAQLHSLVLRRDTYDTDVDFSHSQRYYVDTFATPEDLGYRTIPGDPSRGVPAHARGPLLDMTLGKPFWERKHLKLVNSEATKYLEAFPALEWAYIGERSIRISTSKGDVQSRHIESVTELENEVRYLDGIFGEWVY